MYLTKWNKTMARVLVMTLAVSAASPAITALASSTAAQTEQSEAAGGAKEGPPDGSQPPKGDQPGQKPPEGGNGQAPPQVPGGADTMSYDYKGDYQAALIVDGKEESHENKTISASSESQNSLLVKNGGTLTFKQGTLKKSGDDTNGDNCNFYGTNSILLAVNKGSMAYIYDSSLLADSEGSNGIFATDQGTVYASNNTITTTANNSRGLDATYGGTIIADKMDISTKGDHSAAIATDRGGGFISASNSTLNTAGSGSPLIYSTGSIEADNVTGTALGSQIAGMEGLNTIRIYNSALTSTNQGTTGSDPVANGIIIYQSTSGDAEASTGDTATFEAADSTLKSAVQDGTMFYLTNTKANVVLSNTVLDFDSSKSNLLTIQGNDSNNWGTSGSNGADVKFTGIEETLSGNIDVDTISSLDLYLLKNTVYTGTTKVTSNTVNTSSSSAPITINLDGTSQWIVTGDSTVTNLNAQSGSSIKDLEGKTVSVVAEGKTVVTGTSAYTVTVTGKYSDVIATDSGNELGTSYIDRAAFDQYYAVTTSFGQNGTSPSGGTEPSAEAVTSVSDETAGSHAEKTNNQVAAKIGAAVLCLALAGGIFSWYRKKRK
jgi:hypothetical protein